MKKSLTIFSVLFCLAVSAQNLPFPQHYKYTSQSVKPSNYTQYQLDSVVTRFYDAWKARYFRNTCNSNQYFVWFGDEDSTINSVSEGQGYGMMIAAYMAGYDPNAKTIYDGLFNYYKSHLDSISFELMAWEQNTSCVDTSGADDATDGDMDIAYSLLLADKQWGSKGSINYLQEATKMIDSMMVYVVNKNEFSTELGDWAGHNMYPPDSSFNPADYYATRPSDFMPDHFRAFQNATNDTRWTKVLDECYSIINTIQTNNSPVTGLIPDFVVSCNTTPVPAAANFLEGPYDGEYNYNSCRVPWRLTTDYLISGEARAKTAVDKINSWIRSSTSNVPSAINSGFMLNGNNIPGNNYSDPSFIGPFAVGAMDNAINQTWLNGVYDFLLSQGIANNTYFPNTLTMLDLIVISGNYWPPYTASATGIKRNDEAINLTRVYPNPSDGAMQFDYGLAPGSIGEFVIYSLSGVRVAVYKLSEGDQHTLKVNGTGLKDGIYFYREIVNGTVTNYGKLSIAR